MSGLPDALMPLLDRPELDLLQLGQSIAAEEGDELDLDHLLALAARLPSGLIHAEAVWISAIAPVGLPPLAAGSNWYAVERALVAAIAPGRIPLAMLVGDLARYALGAQRVRRALEDAPHLIDALIGEEPAEPTVEAELALRLGTDGARLAELRERMPSAVIDLGWMARAPFVPRVHLHPSTRPAKWRRLGQSIARRLLEAQPEGTFRLLIADATEAIEHLSPYVRDLAREILGWAQENPDALSVPEILERLDGSGGLPDLAALVVPDLIAGRPDVLDERRRVERATGLSLFDEAGVTFGLVELSSLAAPDPRAIVVGAKGPLAFIAGRAPETLLEAARDLLEAGRVAALGVVLGFEGRGGVVIPELVVSEDDALAIDGAGRTLKRAEAIGIRAAPLPRAAHEGEAQELLLGLLRLARRAELIGSLPAGAKRIVTLYGRSASSAGTIEQRLALLDAARVALAGLSSPDAAMPQRGVEASKSPGSLRFRA
ncbi:MAG: hypothetical protein IT384_08685 [Deltaproteobacteria bacterium]|nr:hypothetical protein [Deltaproteobacteria bacterium]